MAERHNTDSSEVRIMDKSGSGNGRYLLKQLARHYKIRRIDIGRDAHLSRSVFVFNTRTYEIEDVGHVCIMKVPGKQTLLGGLYDTQLAPWPEDQLFGQETAYRMVIHHMYGA